MKALVLAPFLEESLGVLRRRVEVVYEPWTETRRLWDPRELAQRLRAEEIGIVVIEADFLFEDVFAEGTPLRFVGVCRAALNHVDLEAATLRNVLVVNTPGRNAQAVAEHTLALLLALTRRIPPAHAYVQAGRWEDPMEPYITMRAVELGGKTLGVVGLGRVGRLVARLGRAFSMRVVGSDPYAKIPRGVQALALDELLRQSDVVTLHAPEPPTGVRLLDAKKLALMKPTTYLINTAAPGLVDAEALAEALQGGQLAGAGLDVFDSAPLPKSSPLLSLENVVLTPHIGGATDATIARYSRSMTEDVLRFLDGRVPLRAVNRRVLGRWRG
ncbi:MAG: 3-phosphoglycerate dehydrogenase [Dehalococcoidia bacterium]|nr:3-phosphoglycerate dehydrogenase [Dehalococcoidia bacterium]